MTDPKASRVPAVTRVTAGRKGHLAPVVPLRLVQRKPEPVIVDALKAALAMAEKGEIVGLFLACEVTEERIFIAAEMAQGANLSILCGAVKILDADLMKRER